MGLWTMLTFCQDAGSSTPLIPSYLCFIHGNTLYKYWSTSCRVQGDVKSKYLISQWATFDSPIVFTPTDSYKQEDRYNLPCLSILTPLFTEIRYKIKLTSNQKEKQGNKLDVQKKTTTLLLFYVCMQSSSKEGTDLNPSIPTYTPLSEGRGTKRWNAVSNTQEWVSRREQRMKSTLLGKVLQNVHALIVFDSGEVIVGSKIFTQWSSKGKQPPTERNRNVLKP